MVSLVQEIKAYGIGSIKKGERNWWGNTESLIKFSSFYRWRSSKELVWEILLRYDDNTSTLIYSSHLFSLLVWYYVSSFNSFRLKQHQNIPLLTLWSSNIVLFLLNTRSVLSPLFGITSYDTAKERLNL